MTLMKLICISSGIVLTHRFFGLNSPIFINRNVLQGFSLLFKDVLFGSFLYWHSTEVVAFFHSLSSPLFSLLARLSRLIYWETLSARLSKLKDYGFDQLVSQCNWHHLLVEKPAFWGTWLPWRNVHSWLYDGRVGEVVNRMSSGSSRGGHWRYLPIRWYHDNRYFADWIRLCPGLSKNSENGNSCPKPHKAARHDWSSGKSTSPVAKSESMVVSIETETINRNMDSIMEKLTALQRKIDIGDQNGQRE